MVWLYLNVSGIPTYSAYSTYSTLEQQVGECLGHPPRGLGLGVRKSDLVVVISASVIRGANPWSPVNQERRSRSILHR